MSNYFAISGLCIGIINLCLAVLISKFAKIKLHKVWSFVNYSISLWGFGMFISGSTESHDVAFIGWKIFNVGIILIAVIYYHVVHLFCNLKDKKFLIFSYAQGLIFIALTIFTNLMFGDSLVFSFGQFYYFKAGIFHHLLMFIWTIIVGDAFYELYKYIKKSSGVTKIQGKYLFIAMMFGFGGGLNTAPAAWGFNIYPYGQILVCIYGLVATYAIFRYKLMNIKIAFSRLGIFIVVYSVVLGIPFGGLVWGKSWLTQVFGDSWYWTPMLSLLILATAGPFIYLYFQQRAEKHILQEERRTQELLLQASYGMTSARLLSQLFRLIVDMLSKILKIQKVQLYILNQAINKYELMGPVFDKDPVPIDGEEAIITELMRRKYPVTYDEIKFKAEGNHNEHLKNVLAQMNKLSCHVIVPIVFETDLLGFIVLGDYKGKEIYSNELINVLAVFGNQAALAIKNCYFLEDEARRMEKASADERRVSLDHMTSSMAHEIDNPMAIIRSHSELLKNSLEHSCLKDLPGGLKANIDNSLSYILEASSRVSGMIRAIEDYSRKATSDLTPIKLYEAIEGYRMLTGHWLKKNPKVHYTQDIADNLPYMLGDKIQLEEIFVNFLKNALHAVQWADVKEVSLKIFQKNDDWIRIEFADTGGGIGKNMINDIFLAHVTTKGSSEGSGLGLYRVRKIVELHKGRIWAESQGKGLGSRFIVEFPIFKGDINAYRQEPEQGPRVKF